MTGILDTVDKRTQLVGENRLELLTFHLHSKQQYAVNVFKVQEVVSLPNLTMIPNRHPAVCGVTHLRGKTIPVIDLSKSMGYAQLNPEQSCKIIVCEYNRTVQAFLVKSVDRIVNLNWEDILPPPSGTGIKHFLTSITRLDEEIIEILDVEKILAEINPYDTRLSAEMLDQKVCDVVRGKRVLLVDDSAVARAQGIDVLTQMGLKVTAETDGKKALALLKKWADEQPGLIENLFMVVTDAEMPEMDGYRLTTEIRKDPRLKHLYVVLHTSLSGSFNNAMIEKVGCDGFLSKFIPDSLAEYVHKKVKEKYNF